MAISKSGGCAPVGVKGFQVFVFEAMLFGSFFGAVWTTFETDKTEMKWVK